MYKILNGAMYAPDREIGPGKVSKDIMCCMPYIKCVCACPFHYHVAIMSPCVETASVCWCVCACAYIRGPLTCTHTRNLKRAHTRTARGA